MNIVGKKVVLRAIELEDLPALQRWANDPAIQSMLGGWHFPVSSQDQRKWFETLSVNSNNQRFAIDLPGAGLVGTANLVSIDWQNGNAFHGMMIGNQEHRGTGVAMDALMTIMRYAFEELDLYRLDTDIIEYNERSLKFYLQKGGWSREGIRPNWYFRKGRRWDKVMVGVTREAYQDHSARIGYWADKA